MKKIINKKLYNTETALNLAEYWHRYNRGDFSWYEEVLYVKRTGEYFLYGKGGPASPYAVPVDSHTMSGGEKIIPLTLEEAKEWAEEKVDADDYIELFGPVEE